MEVGTAGVAAEEGIGHRTADTGSKGSLGVGTRGLGPAPSRLGYRMEAGRRRGRRSGFPVAVGRRRVVVAADRASTVLEAAMNIGLVNATAVGRRIDRHRIGCVAEDIGLEAGTGLKGGIGRPEGIGLREDTGSEIGIGFAVGIDFAGEDSLRHHCCRSNLGSTCWARSIDAVSCIRGYIDMCLYVPISWMRC